MSSKLFINWNEGRLEVEGSEELIREIYSDFKNLGVFTKKTSKPPVSSGSGQDDESKVDTSGDEKKRNGTVRTQKTKSAKPKLVSDLNLRPPDKQSLKDFVGQYPKHSAGEHSLLIIYYLKQILEVDKVAIDHVFTCMTDLGDRLPGDLGNLLRTHSSRYKWIDIGNANNLGFNVHGQNHINHDIKKGDKSTNQPE